MDFPGEIKADIPAKSRVFQRKATFTSNLLGFSTIFNFFKVSFAVVGGNYGI